MLYIGEERVYIKTCTIREIQIKIRSSSEYVYIEEPIIVGEGQWKKIF